VKRATALGVLSSLVASSRVSGQTLKPIVLGYTTRTATDWPEYVGEKAGFFTANGIKSDVVIVGSASAVAQQLIAGALNVGETSMTQLIAAVENGAPLTAVAVLFSTAPYWVLGRKPISSIEQLKGKTIVVGGPNDITRIFMDAVLERHGLRPDDYTLTYLGTTGERYAALISGAADAAILNPPVSFNAADAGYSVLDDVHKYFPNFANGVYVAHPEWARSNSDLLVSFLTAHLQSVRWLYNRANKARAIQILSETANAKPEDATRTYDLYIGSLRYFTPTARLSDDAVANVQNALVKTKQLRSPLAAPGKYFDNRYVDAALARLPNR
jgi:NitT/TauT family transport system substrate-binding protein